MSGQYRSRMHFCQAFKDKRMLTNVWRVWTDHFRSARSTDLLFASLRLFKASALFIIWCNFPPDCRCFNIFPPKRLGLRLRGDLPTFAQLPSVFSFFFKDGYEDCQVLSITCNYPGGALLPFSSRYHLSCPITVDVTRLSAANVSHLPRGTPAHCRRLQTDIYCSLPFVVISRRCWAIFCSPGASVSLSLSQMTVWVFVLLPLSVCYFPAIVCPS